MWVGTHRYIGCCVLLFLCMCSLTHAQDVCTAAQRDWCAMSFCTQCDLHNGIPVCTSEPVEILGQVCVNPCFNNSIDTVPLPGLPGPPSPPVLAAACAYFDTLNTLHTQALVPLCAVVQTELDCEQLAGTGEYDFGAAGSTCGTIVLRNGLNTTLGSSACCPDGKLMAILTGTAQLVCLEDDPSYTGPLLNATVYAFNASGDGGCLPDPIEIILEAGVGLSALPNDTNLCSACVTLTPGLNCSEFVDPLAPLGCFAFFGTTAPPAVAPPSPPAPPVSVFNATSVSLGVCVAGFCVGPLNTTLIASNPTNDACMTGFCGPSLRQDVVSGSFFDADDPSVWPSPSCHPGCPGFPVCGGGDCPGFPNFQDALRYLEPSLSSTDLVENSLCRRADLCAPDGVCSGSSVCIPLHSRGPVCERFTCRFCVAANGTCRGAPVPAGFPCRAGCLENTAGVCDGAGNCVGPDVGSAACEQFVLDVGLREPKDTLCYDAPCIRKPIPFVDDPPEIVDVILGLPRIMEGIQAIIDNALLGTMQNPCEVFVANVSAPCDDQDKCTLNDTCNAVGFCTPEKDRNIVCQEQCAPCSQITGQCNFTAPLLFGQPCKSACGISTRREGICPEGDPAVVGRCIPLFPDPALCILASSDVCRRSTCLSFFNTTQAVPFGVPLNDIPGFLNNHEAHVCLIQDLDNGTTCSSVAGSANVCIIEELCDSGECVVESEIVCDTVFSIPCVNQNASLCDPLNGQCVPTPFPNGTSCDDGSLCTTNNTCFTLPPMLGVFSLPVCEGVPIVNCSTPPSVCKFAGSCDPFDGSCSFANRPNGAPCNLTAPGLCDAEGVCTNGLCTANPTMCPQDANACTVASCNPGTGNCDDIPILDGTPCNDGDTCTDNDICVSGVCAGIPNNCLPSPSECLVPTGPCTSGTCEYVAVTDLTPCMAGLGECQTGACVPICIPACIPDNVCVDGVCQCVGVLIGPFCNETAPSAPPSVSVFGLGLTFPTNLLRIVIFSLAMLALLLFVVSMMVVYFCNLYNLRIRLPEAPHPSAKRRPI